MNELEEHRRIILQAYWKGFMVAAILGGAVIAVLIMQMSKLTDAV
jgi:hypothetical protein|tara:strand:+ start:3915 stop:4049 length:135 start_codon:yes stop_codon:yes gene_type:complete